ERELKRLQKDLKLKSLETRFDEEHNLWALVFVNAQGAEHVINWELASTPECRQLITKFKQIEQYLDPPFMIESVVKPAKTAASVDEKDENEDENVTAGEGEEATKAEKKSGKAPVR